MQERAERTCFDGARPAVNHLVYGHFKQLVVPQWSVAHHDGIVELSACVRAYRSLAAARDDGVVAVVMVEPEFVRVLVYAHVDVGQVRRVYNNPTMQCSAHSRRKTRSSDQCVSRNHKTNKKFVSRFRDNNNVSVVNVTF